MPSPSPDAFVGTFGHGYAARRFARCGRALELGLAGSATNKHDGRVHVVAEGPRSQCERLVELVKTGDTPGRVDLVVENYSTPRGGRNEFLIR